MAVVTDRYDHPWDGHGSRSVLQFLYVSRLSVILEILTMRLKVLAKMPYFLLHEAALNNAKDTTMTIISQSTTIAKDLLSDNNP